MTNSSPLTMRILGDRGSGKTTYLAALLRNPHNNPDTDVVQRIIPQNSDTEELQKLAMNILEKGLDMKPTPISVIKNYVLNIELKVSPPNIDLGRFNPLKRNSPSNSSGIVELNINCKDYSGEYFGDITTIASTSSQQFQDYLTDCATSKSILFLIDGMSFSRDDEYEVRIIEFLRQLDRNTIGGWKGRFALGLSKCENMEIWGTLKSLKSEQKSLKDYVKTRFPKFSGALQTPKSVEIEYFALSAFGITGNDQPSANVTYISNPKPNDPTAKSAIIKNPRVWKPFGLISPLYWLATGKNLDLD